MNLKVVRDELVQSYVWAQARNDALKYVKDQLKAQLRDERKLVSSYEDEMRGLEEQDYVIGKRTRYYTDYSSFLFLLLFIILFLFL